MCQALIVGDDLEEYLTSKVSVKGMKRKTTKKENKRTRQFLTAARRKIKQ